MSVSLLALARFTLKGPYQAAGTVALLAVLAVFLPVLAQGSPALLMLVVFFSFALQFTAGSLVGLIILTQGSASGLKPILASIVGISLVGWGLIGMPELGLSTGLAQWLPIILLAQTLRSTRSLALTLLAGVLLGALVIAAQYLVLGDLQGQWLEMMQQRSGAVGEQEQALATSYVELVRWMVASMVAIAYVIFVAILLMARSLQARLSESAGFGNEFRSLTLGKPAALAALVIVVAGMLLQQAWIDSLGYLVLSAFLFQGIAVLHHRLAPKKQAGLLLGLYYFLLMFLWRIVMPLTAITGMVDNWLAFRKKT